MDTMTHAFSVTASTSSSKFLLVHHTFNLVPGSANVDSVRRQAFRLQRITCGFLYQLRERFKAARPFQISSLFSKIPAWFPSILELEFL